MSKRVPSPANGILIVNKHGGVTSHDIVSAVRRLFDTPKVGHTGTLDPMATGVLPILLGRAVKAADLLLSENKEYEAELALGVTTDTEDVTGKILSESNEIPDKERVLEVCRSFRGKIMQTPPMYSALKSGGRKLCDIAREGGEVERAPREIEIYSIEPKAVSDRVYRIRVSCSKGTYIRTLCADIGHALGCGAAMSALCRTRTGSFTIEDSVTVEDLEKMTFEERLALPRPTESLFKDLPEVELGDFFAKLAKNGAEIYQKKIAVSFEDGALIRLKHGGEFFALGKAVTFPGGPAIKPVKLFKL
ncbi:MAG: tRNA pseudouridine(55) synthase TruB [Clostridia bacterium]|nr:tRNA pseudouridine(55) synthase TruB [Clostridia bacterium]